MLSQRKAYKQIIQIKIFKQDEFISSDTNKNLLQYILGRLYKAVNKPNIKMFKCY